MHSSYGEVPERTLGESRVDRRTFFKAIYCDSKKPAQGGYLPGEVLVEDELDVMVMLVHILDSLPACMECIRRRVMESLNANPGCAGKDALEAVWDVCYDDTQPFDKAP